MSRPPDIGIEGLDDVVFIGQGGSARVYVATQDHLARQVAVKVISDGDTEAVLRRFGREQRAMGRLSSYRGVVQVFEAGETEFGEPYLIMEYITGGSVAEWIAANGPMPWRQAVELVATVAETVEYAHNAGVLHRDLKPANILLRDDGGPVVADFGISQLGGSVSAAHSTSITMTPAYSPPEAFHSGDGTKAVDVYGLGATLWALLSGRAPFVESNGSAPLGLLLARIVGEPVGDLRPTVPDPVCTVLETAMAKAPEDRYANAGDLAIALRRAQELGQAAEAAGATAASEGSEGTDTVVVEDPDSADGAAGPAARIAGDRVDGDLVDGHRVDGGRVDGGRVDDGVTTIEGPSAAGRDSESTAQPHVEAEPAPKPAAPRPGLFGPPPGEVAPPPAPATASPGPSSPPSPSTGPQRAATNTSPDPDIDIREPAVAAASPKRRSSVLLMLPLLLLLGGGAVVASLFLGGDTEPKPLSPLTRVTVLGTAIERDSVPPTGPSTTAFTPAPITTTAPSTTAATTTTSATTSTDAPTQSSPAPASPPAAVNPPPSQPRTTPPPQVTVKPDPPTTPPTTVRPEPPTTPPTTLRPDPPITPEPPPPPGPTVTTLF